MCHIEHFVCTKTTMLAVVAMTVPAMQSSVALIVIVTIAGIPSPSLAVYQRSYHDDAF